MNYRKRLREQGKEIRRVKRLLSCARRVPLTKKAENAYGELTGDSHLIHMFPRLARQAGIGFKRCPVRGAHMAAIAGNLEYGIYLLANPDNEGLIIHQKTTFPRPVYQQKRLNLLNVPSWLYGGIEQNGAQGALKIKVTAHVRKMIVLESVLEIKSQKEPCEPLRKSLVTPVTSSIELRMEDLINNISWMHRQSASGTQLTRGLVQSYAPATLVRILEKAYGDVDIPQRPLPINLAMETTWYEPAHEGIIEVETRMTREKLLKNSAIYDFSVRFMQDDAILATTEIRSASNKPLDKDRIDGVRTLPTYRRPQ
ncbi:MAG: hypothetical protein AABY02_00325 [Nanoarchaeota archaeon]